MVDSTSKPSLVLLARKLFGEISIMAWDDWQECHHFQICMIFFTLSHANREYFLVFLDFYDSKLYIFWFLGCQSDKTRHLKTPMGSGNLWWAFFTICWHFMDQTINRFFKKIISKWIGNENNRLLQLESGNFSIKNADQSLLVFSVLYRHKLNIFWLDVTSVSGKLWLVFLTISGHFIDLIDQSKI